MIKPIELTDISGNRFFLISDVWSIWEGSKDTARLINHQDHSSTGLKDKYSDLVHIYGVTTNPRVKKGK